MVRRPIETECIKHNFIGDNNFFSSHLFIHFVISLPFHFIIQKLMKYSGSWLASGFYYSSLLLNAHFITIQSMATLLLLDAVASSAVDLLKSIKVFSKHKSDQRFFFLM